MTLEQLQSILKSQQDTALHLMLPDGDFVPAHFHITEVGRVQKDFIDCGGTSRSVTSCLLQVWVANDTDHRLDTTKLAKIIDLAAPLLKTTDLPVEVEFENGVISQYPLMEAESTPSGILFHLGKKHTACLAEDRCGITPAASSCCSTPGCC